MENRIIDTNVRTGRCYVTLEVKVMEIKLRGVLCGSASFDDLNKRVDVAGDWY